MMLEEFYRTRMHNKQIIGQLEIQVRIGNNNSKKLYTLQNSSITIVYCHHNLSFFFFFYDIGKLHSN